MHVRIGKHHGGHAYFLNFSVFFYLPFQMEYFSAAVWSWHYTWLNLTLLVEMNMEIFFLFFGSLVNSPIFSFKNDQKWMGVPPGTDIRSLILGKKLISATSYSSEEAKNMLFSLTFNGELYF